MSRYFAARGWILAAAFLALLAARAASDAPLRPAWLLLAVAGVFLRIWAGAHLGDHGNAATAGAPSLATTGPYRFSRNPLYVSNLLVAAGLTVYANALAPALAAILLAGVFLHHTLLIAHEERALLERFGEAYNAYRRGTSRWLGPPQANGKKDGGGISLRTLLARQGRNAGYALAGVILLWAARWF